MSATDSTKEAHEGVDLQDRCGVLGVRERYIHHDRLESEEDTLHENLEVSFFAFAERTLGNRLTGR